MAQPVSGESQPGPKYYGLLNQGATCYLNSVLQVLFMTEDFKERVRSHTRDNAETQHLDRELTDLFSDLEKYQAATFNITNRLRINNVKEQRDAAEHYEKILRLTSPEASQLFHGSLVNRSTCEECGDRTESEALFWHLPLPLVESDYSVEKGFGDFFRQSVISGVDQMYCEKCDKKCDAVLDCEVKQHPEILVLLLKRFEFNYEYMRYVKNNSVVHVPHTLHTPQNQFYELYGFVEHLGEQQFGRYIAKIWSHDDGKWYIFDDSNVVLSDYQYFQLDPTEKSQTAYLLFYRKRKAKYHGLVKLGQTCYLNSILQVLFMTEDFRERVKSHTSHNTDTEHIDSELSDLFSDLETYNAAYTFKVINKLKINNVDEQQDAAEYYEKILYLTSPEASEIFHGELINRSTCVNCNKQTQRTTGFWHLPLSLVDSQNEYSVDQNIKTFFSRGGGEMYCEACDQNSYIALDCEVKHHPEVLVLLLKRFEFDERNMTCVVDVPYTLHLPPNQSYELYGFVEHLGEQQFGRYIAKIRSQDDGRWYIFDNSNVSMSDYQYFQFYPTEKSQIAYLLFYRKLKVNYRGLVNLGATCYLNSVLQVLFMTEDFKDRVKSHTTNVAGTEHIDSELSELFNDLEKYSTAYTFKISKKLKIKNVDEQRDAAEHYEKILRLTSPEASQIFHGELINRSTCLNCNKQIERTTGFWHLPLSLVDSQDEYSVNQSIKDFFSRGGEMYCEACDQNCYIALDCEVKHHPEVLVLLLKRFEFDERHMTYVKVNCAVDVPYTLHLPQSQSYELYACVEHFGELRCGHYFARIRSTHDGRWYIFDDLNVLRPNNHCQWNPAEKSQTAYLLYYRKQKDTVPGVISNVTTAEASQMEDASGTEDSQSTIKQEEQEKQETFNIRTTAISVRTEIEHNSSIEAQKRALNEADTNTQGDCDERFEETDVSDSSQQTHDPNVDTLTNLMKAMDISDHGMLDTKHNDLKPNDADQAVFRHQFVSENPGQSFDQDSAYVDKREESLGTQKLQNWPDSKTEKLVNWSEGSDGVALAETKNSTETAKNDCKHGVDGDQYQKGHEKGYANIRLDHGLSGVPVNMQDSRLTEQMDIENQSTYVNSDFHASRQNQGRTIREGSAQINSLANCCLREPYHIHYPQPLLPEEHRRVEATKEFIRNELKIKNQKGGTSKEVSATGSSERPMQHDYDVLCNPLNRGSRAEGYSQGFERVNVTTEGDTEVVRVIPKKKKH